MAGSVNMLRTLGAFTFAACGGFAHAFEPVTVAGRPLLQAGTGKRGVHVGGNADTRAASLAELDQFLARHLQQK